MGLLIYKASDEEQRIDMPGDSLVPKPISTNTQAITVKASIERIWLWLVHMWSGYGG